jgi:hypothetical protein
MPIISNKVEPITMNSTCVNLELNSFALQRMIKCSELQSFRE